MTAAQYCDFLNKVAKTDTCGLYNTNMDAANNQYGCNIILPNSSSTPPKRDMRGGAYDGIDYDLLASSRYYYNYDHGLTSAYEGRDIGFRVAQAVPDTTPPTVAVTCPTQTELHSTNLPNLNFGGTASDDVAISEVTWSNSRGGSGSCIGTNSWTSTSIPLQVGDNVITVIAHDDAGNVSSDTININYDPEWTTLYENGFEGPVGSEWSTSVTEMSQAGNRRFLGRFATGATDLTLQSLPPHVGLILRCDLITMLSWDGSCVNGNSNNVVGPDVWSLSTDGGPSLMHTTFALYPWSDSHGGQAYPDNYPGGGYAGRTGAIENNTLGYVYNDSFYPNDPEDAVYSLSFVLPHTSNTVSFSFSGSGLESVANESWGLDNVQIMILPPPVNLLGGVRSLEDGTPVSVDDAVVTATSIEPGIVFVESSNRCAGIKLVTDRSLNRGDRVKFSGVVDRENGECWITNVVFSDITGGQELSPVGVTTREVGNDPTEFLDYQGINITGLLVRMAGEVNGVVSLERVIYVNDGFNYQDGVGPVRGIRVHIPENMTMPTKIKGKSVVVTGILRVEKHVISSDYSEVNGDFYPRGTVIYVPSIWVRDAEDLRVIN